MCIAFKDSSDPVMIGMLLTYILGLTDAVLYLIYEIGQMEKQMVSIQRLFKITE